MHVSEATLHSNGSLQHANGTLVHADLAEQQQLLELNSSALTDETIQDSASDAAAAHHSAVITVVVIVLSFVLVVLLSFGFAKLAWPYGDSKRSDGLRRRSRPQSQLEDMQFRASQWAMGGKAEAGAALRQDYKDIQRTASASVEALSYARSAVWRSSKGEALPQPVLRTMTSRDIEAPQGVAARSWGLHMACSPYAIARMRHSPPKSGGSLVIDAGLRRPPLKQKQAVFVDRERGGGGGGKEVERRPPQFVMPRSYETRRRKTISTPMARIRFLRGFRPAGASVISSCGNAGSVTSLASPTSPSTPVMPLTPQTPLTPLRPSLTPALTLQDVEQCFAAKAASAEPAAAPNRSITHTQTSGAHIHTSPACLATQGSFKRGMEGLHCSASPPQDAAAQRPPPHSASGSQPVVSPLASGRVPKCARRELFPFCGRLSTNSPIASVPYVHPTSAAHLPFSPPHSPDNRAASPTPLDQNSRTLSEASIAITATPAVKAFSLVNVPANLARAKRMQSPHSKIPVRQVSVVEVAIPSPRGEEQWGIEQPTGYVRKGDGTWVPEGSDAPTKGPLSASLTHGACGDVQVEGGLRI